MLYRTGIVEHLVGYTDVDWAGHAGYRRSISGFTFSVGSVVIVWSSKKQPKVALSSTEAECRGAVVATCEAIWLKRLLKDLHVDASDPTMIYCNNPCTIHLANNPVFHARAKHIAVHYHFARERVLSGEVKLVYVPTDRQTTDIFTKPLGLNKLRQFSSVLGLQHLDMPNLRGRKRQRSRRDQKCESNEEFDFRLAEEVEDGYGERNQRNEPKLKTIELGVDKEKKSKGTRIKTWSDVVKGSGEYESETTDSVEKSDPDETDSMKAEQKRGN